MTATDNLGAHLLGRKPMPRDDRDYLLADFLASHDRLVADLTPATTLEELRAAGPLEAWSEIYAFWSWFKQHIIGAPTPPDGPPPQPDPTSVAKVWADPDMTMDQGQTPECVGACGANWKNTLPVNDHVGHAEISRLYLACKIIDGEPGAMDGSNSRSLCKVLKNEGRIGAYAFAANADDVAAFVSQHGPIGTGTNWTNDMFTPNADNYLKPSGGVAGGHEWLIVGYSPTGYGSVSAPSFTMQNSWGAGWGIAGRAYITKSDYQSLLADGGDAWAALENAL